MRPRTLFRKRWRVVVHYSLIGDYVVNEFWLRLSARRCADRLNREVADDPTVDYLAEACVVERIQ